MTTMTSVFVATMPAVEGGPAAFRPALGEIKFHGCRLMVRWDGPRVRCSTRNPGDGAVQLGKFVTFTTLPLAS